MCFLTLALSCQLVAAICSADEKPARLIVLADIGNEPDEVQQMPHLLVCAKEVDVKGLLAMSGNYLGADHPKPARGEMRPELFHEPIDGYEKVLPNLRLRWEEWSTPGHLRDVLKTDQAACRIAAVGEGQINAKLR